MFLVCCWIACLLLTNVASLDALHPRQCFGLPFISSHFFRVATLIACDVLCLFPPVDRWDAQGLGVVVVAAVAFLAVAQQQLRGGGGRDEALGEGLAATATANNHNSYYGLVGLSLTYALPIVGVNHFFIYILGV